MNSIQVVYLIKLNPLLILIKMEALPFFFLVGIFLIFISGGIHKISEGYIGLYWRGGALMEGYTEPGFHLMTPFVTQMAEVQVSVETDLVEDIPVSNSVK